MFGPGWLRTVSDCTSIRRWRHESRHYVRATAGAFDFNGIGYLVGKKTEILTCTPRHIRKGFGTMSHSAALRGWYVPGQVCGCATSAGTSVGR